MRKRLALVLLAPECSSWQPIAAGAAVPAGLDTLPLFAPWAAAQALTQAWLDMLMQWMAWVFSPQSGDLPVGTRLS